ncbi:MAG: acyclic terpene utilization AtuA family protein, partial [Dietzia cercidiphylli]
MTSTQRPLRIGNVSASRTDRATATAEFLSAASLDVLALDMLSDEAMLELAEQRAQGDPGHERALLVQLGECLDLVGTGGVRIVTNAGALDPGGLAEALRAMAADAGVELSVASVDSGDVTDRAVELGLGEADVATVRHGAFGIARALAAGAHVVVTGRVSREALVTGAAAAHHGWTPSALDALAGSVAVGHVLSGGPGATGVVDSSTDVTRTTDP